MARNYLRRLTFSKIEQASTRELRSYYSNLRDIYVKQTKRYVKQSPDTAWQFEPPKNGKLAGPRYFHTLAERPNIPYLKGQSAEVMRRDLERSVKELSQLIIQRDLSGKILTDTGYNVPSISFEKARTSKINKQLFQMIKKEYYHNIDVKTSKTFKQNGFNISPGMVKKLGKFMDRLRIEYGKKIPGSDKVVEFFSNLRYDVKRKSIEYLYDLYKDWERNGYETTDEQTDLFST